MRFDNIAGLVVFSASNTKIRKRIKQLVVVYVSILFESIKDKLCVIGARAFLFAILIYLIKSPLLKKNKVKYNILLLGFLLIPVIIDPVNKMWHAGGYQSFPMRFGYITVFYNDCSCFASA